MTEAELKIVEDILIEKLDEYHETLPMKDYLRAMNAITMALNILEENA